jgi:hypothetical protein
MREHGRPGWYSWLVVVLVPIMASVAVLVVSLRVNQRSIERERVARIASEQAFCAIIVLIDDSYRQQKPPPGTATARLALAISNARVVNHCPPYQGAGK